MPETLRIFVDRIATPVGEMMLAVDAEGRLRGAHWDETEEGLALTLGRHHATRDARIETARDPGGVSSVLTAYFAGASRAIEAIEVGASGTPFQQEVWAELRRIPCGTTISYAELARRIGRPSAVRAVGLANGANPVAVVVPCHRVIGSSGALTGYAGGLERKRWLLAHEGALEPNSLPLLATAAR